MALFLISTPSLYYTVDAKTERIVVIRSGSILRVFAPPEQRRALVKKPFLRFALAGTFLLFGAGSMVSCTKASPSSTGGVVISERLDGRSCGRGLAVLMTDYVSTNVALLGLDGETLSGSFISSASAETKLNAPLSGDVVFPSSRMDDELVLIDGLHISVLSFVEVHNAKVRAQLPVRTGFSSNPQDYLALGEGRALVSRLEQNSRPGSETFDGGDDLIWVDATKPEVAGRVDLSLAREGTRARPGALVLAQGLVFAALSGHSADFQEAPAARLVAIDPNDGEILFTHALDGVKNCRGLAVSPDERQLALSCSGLMSDVANEPDPPNSALVVLSIDEVGAGLTEVTRLSAAELGWGPLGFSVGFASPGVLLAGAFGALEGSDAGRPDSVFSFSVETGKVQKLLISEGLPFTLGDIQCMEACERCFVADAGRSLIHRFAPDSEGKFSATAHTVDTDIRLPPRLLGWF
jgi:hypothetical protein